MNWHRELARKSTRDVIRRGMCCDTPVLQQVSESRAIKHAVVQVTDGGKDRTDMKQDHLRGELGGHLGKDRDHVEEAPTSERSRG